MQPTRKVPNRSMVVSRDVAGLLDAELLELEPLEEEPVAVLPLPLVTAVQTPNPVVEAMYALLVEGIRDAQTGLDRKEASKLDIAAT